MSSPGVVGGVGLFDSILSAALDKKVHSLYTEIIFQMEFYL
jgi:hypothetical protein